VGWRWGGSLNWGAGGKQESYQKNTNVKVFYFHRSFLSERRQVDADDLIVPNFDKPVSEGETKL